MPSSWEQETGREEPGHVPPQHRSTTVPLGESLLSGTHRCLSDMGAFMGRSFRVGWGPGWALSHTGPALAVEQDGASQERESKPASPTPPPSFLFVGSLASRPKVAKAVEGPRYVLGHCESAGVCGRSPAIVRVVGVWYEPSDCEGCRGLWLGPKYVQGHCEGCVVGT